MPTIPLPTIARYFPLGSYKKPLQRLHFYSRKMITQRSDLSSTQQFDSKVIKYGLLNTENRRIENFAYWHDRLVIFKEFFDEAEQSTLSVSSGLRRRRPL